MIKRAINIFVSIYAMIAIIIGSMMQFHHHLRNGDVHVVYGAIIMSLVDGQELPSAREVHDSHRSCSSDDQEGCSIKLSFFDSASHQSNNQVLLVLPMLSVLGQYFLVPADCCIHGEGVPQYYKNILTHLFKVCASGLRSPPSA